MWLYFNKFVLYILDSYSVGQIASCTDVAGGFMGNLVNNPSSTMNLASLYTAVDTPILCDVRGGFAGKITASSSSSNIINRCFWERDNLLDKDVNSIGANNNQAIEFEYHTPSEMRDTAIFEGWNVNTWKFVKGSTPTLRWE